MSQDLSDAKRGTGSVYPEATYDSAPGLNRVEPPLDGEKLRIRFLGGIPMVYPTTKEQITPEVLNDFIERAKNAVEFDTKTNVTTTVRRVRLPFDPVLYESNIWCEVPFKPVQKVLRLAICSASYINTAQQGAEYPSGAEIYKIPNDWIDMSYAVHGRIFVNPINPAFSAIGTSTAAAASGAGILQFIGQQSWVPAYWTMEVLVGFCSENGHLPVIMNEIVGAKAAMLLIDNLIPSYKIASQSMGIDGLSQSVNDMAYQLLTQKRQQLEKDYIESVKKIKILLGNTFFASNV